MDYRPAAADAGYTDGSNYAALMKRPLIRAALYQKTKEAEKEGDINSGQWLRELSTIAFMPSGMLAGKPTWDHKLKAIELMGKYQKWLVENVNVRATVGIAHLFGAATQATMRDAIALSQKPAALEHKPGEALVTAFADNVLEHAPLEGKS